LLLNLLLNAQQAMAAWRSAVAMARTDMSVVIDAMLTSGWYQY
jgi:hypothetical protein